MKLSKPLCALILIASALLLSAANSTHAAENPKSPTARNSQHEKPEKQKRQTQETPFPVTESPVSTAPAQPNPTIQGTGTSANPQRWDDWFWQNFSTLLLAILATWGGFIALRTLDAIRDQAKIASDALTKLERPWVIVDLEKAMVWYRHGLYSMSVTLKIRNSGRTPAWLTGHLIKVAKEPLPETPDYGAERQRGPRPIVPSEQSVLAEEERIDLTENEWKNFHLSTMEVAVWGRIHYRGIFDSDHETRFRLRFIPNVGRDPYEPHERVECRAFFDGPDAYNRCT